MATKVKEEPKMLPGFSTAGRVSHLGMTDIVVAQPICPKSQIRGRMVNGRYEPPEVGLGDENDQLSGPGWVNRCIAKGHDPYWSTRQRVITRMTSKIDEEGDEVPVRKEILITDRMLNVTSVSTSTRVGSGNALAWKQKYFAYKPISDFGYAEVCHLSRCQKPITIVSKAYGQFCSEEHLSVCVADEEEKVLTRTNHEYATGEERMVARKRRDQLKAARDMEEWKRVEA